jgi:hypothetical protein
MKRLHPSLGAALAAAALIAPGFAATTFTNADGANNLISNAGNWDSGLPTGQQGTIDSNAQYDSAVTHGGYNILHTGGNLSRGAGFSALALGTNSTYVMNGASAAITVARGIELLANSTFTLINGSANLSDNNRDTQINGTGASITINGGSMTVGRDLINRDGGTFTINGGTVTGIDQFLTQSFATASNGWYFNGGSTTADNFQLDKAGTAYFGGATAGTLTLLVGLGNGVTLDWASGSLMELSVFGADQAYYEGLYTSGTLLYQGANGGSFGDIFKVSDSTLSLVPEPSSSALLAGTLAVGALRRRRRE